ncbi:mobilization protein MobA (plasmid) [Salmonella enterica subsp. enterica serovar Karamoja]|uniref:Mobilization protein MobA n=2 Tax=Salmonella enterica TaxID=28901 RepID=A0A3Q9MX92_SALET|nr:mobilization protein MobA [Salmonella enterica subsp. enterica serovar Karamoja]AZT44335.1 mobilization protein MobA [Salmonella enterica subsp. enterica serovar Karamoja]
MSLLLSRKPLLALIWVSTHLLRRSSFMVPVIADKRRDGKSSFVDLITYVSFRDDKKLDETLSPDMPFVRPSRSKEAVFDRLVGYMDRHASEEQQVVVASFEDGRQQVLCDKVLVETNCFSLATAAAEMNAVASQNVLAGDPVFHYLLSWREEDNPKDADILAAARYTLKRLGMAEHQFVTAIHRDTDNVHCHIAVNRINPISYRAADLWRSKETLQKASRFLEHKYGWAQDNGSWVMNDKGEIVRAKREWQPAPREAQQLEHHADRESLYTYAVDHCRRDIDALLKQSDVSWREVHSILIRAGLELKRKGEGLAVYPQPEDGTTETTQRPIKASRLHPKLTLSYLEPVAGVFKASPSAQRWSPDKRVYAHLIDSEYSDRLHVRDRGARMERRIQRAEEREDLQARYLAYKNAWVKPVIPADEVKRRYQEMARGFQARKARVRITERDPLLRKLMFRAIEVERMVATAELRLELRAERDAIKMDPDNQRMSYRQWVEVQALAQDKAAISQLRGWAYRQKRNARTSSLSANGFLCAVADDVKPLHLRGYETQVTRDGAITYLRDGVACVRDMGRRIEVVPGDTRNIAAAIVVASKKSGEELDVRGSAAFTGDTLKLVSEFNAPRFTKLTLTNPEQQRWMLRQPEVKAANPAPDSSSWGPTNKPAKYTPPKPS